MRTIASPALEPHLAEEPAVVVKSWTSTTPRCTTNICWRSSISRRVGLVVVRLLLVARLVRDQAELERGLGGEKKVVFSTLVSAQMISAYGFRRAR